MYISKLTISGFRSFGDNPVTIPFNNKLVGFIGLNSSGKTTALEALRKLFGGNAERQLCKADFHIGAEEINDAVTERELSIEAIINFDDVADGEDDDAIPHFFSHMVVDEEGAEPYLRVRLEATWWESKLHPDGDIESELFFIKVPEGADEGEDVKHKFPKHLKNLIEVFYVPAIRKPSDQIKYASGTILYRILKKIKWDEGFKEAFQTHVDGISTLFKSQGDVGLIEKSIKSFWTKFHRDERYRETDLNFGNSDFESILKKLEIAFTPTGTRRPYRVDDLGEEFRSLFYLTLVCTLMQVEEKLAAKEDKEDVEIGPTRPLLTILAIEEPENHIAPQLLGRVINILNEIVKKDRTQVVLSSHTPAIVKRLDPTSICHFRITEKYQTQVNTLVLPPKKDEAYKYIKQAVQNYPEIYFAKLVVIGEGETEEVLFSRFMEVMDVDFDDNIITFAPLGHRFVNHIWKLLDALHIDYVTLLDLDIERGGGAWGRIKYIIDQLLYLGVPPKEILTINGGEVITSDIIGEWAADDDIEVESLMTWVKMLKKYNIFYSAPLDLDFVMLKQFSDVYKRIVPKNGGPRIPDKNKKPGEYKKKVEAAIRATLKSEEAIGVCYSEEERELMIWYDYHFLGRGKPSTHILALSEIKNSELKKNCPQVFKEIFENISSRLSITEDD